MILCPARNCSSGGWCDGRRGSDWPWARGGSVQTTETRTTNRKTIPRKLHCRAGEMDEEDWGGRERAGSEQCKQQVHRKNSQFGYGWDMQYSKVTWCTLLNQKGLPIELQLSQFLMSCSYGGRMKPQILRTILISTILYLALRMVLLFKHKIRIVNFIPVIYCEKEKILSAYRRKTIIYPS